MSEQTNHPASRPSPPRRRGRRRGRGRRTRCRGPHNRARISSSPGHGWERSFGSGLGRCRVGSMLSRRRPAGSDLRWSAATRAARYAGSATCLLLGVVAGLQSRPDHITADPERTGPTDLSAQGPTAVTSCPILGAVERREHRRYPEAWSPMSPPGAVKVVVPEDVVGAPEAVHGKR